MRECVCAIMCHLPRYVFRDPFGDEWRLTLNADARVIANDFYSLSPDPKTNVKRGQNAILPMNTSFVR